MMNKSLSIFLICLWINLSFLKAQEVQVLWDSLYFSPATEILNDLILLPDGRLAGAGEVHLKGKPKAGLFLLVDPEKGTIERRLFSNFSNQVLKSVAESDDGTFYLVGHTDVTGDKQGWILRLDEAGEQILNLKPGKEGSNDRLEKILWLDNGTGIVAGFSEQHKGNLWLMVLDGANAQVKDPVGNGMVGSIVGIGKDAQSRLWLAGNIHPDKEKAGAWLMRLDQNALPKNEEKIGGNSYESIYGMSVAEDGTVMLAGRTTPSSSGEDDTWVVEYDPSLPLQASTKTFEFSGDDNATAILKTPGQKRWLAVRNKKGGAYIVTWGNDGFEETPIKLSNSANFRAVALLRTWQNTFIVAGTSKDPKSKRDGIRLICFKNGETLAAKAPLQIQLECDPPKKIEDATQDGLLSPEERASVHFKITNVGDIDVKEGRIKVIKENVQQGLTVVRENQFLPYLTANGGSKNFSVALKGETFLKAGTSRFRLVVEVGGKDILAVPFSVESIETKQTVGGRKTQILIQQPALSGTERRVPWTENSYMLKATIVSTRKLKQDDPKIMVGSTLQEDQKAGAKIEERGMESGFFVYEYAAVVALKDSTNVVRLVLDDCTTDSIIFEVSDAHPDLHVLAIGPSYADLKYTGKDAKEIAEAFAKQAGKGFFGKVFVDTLTTPLKTTKTQVDKAFNRLLQRHLSNDSPNRIKPNDYVFIMYSGHGMKLDNRFFLVPTDYDPEAPIATTIDYKFVLETYLNKIPCKKALFIDACLSGAAKSNMADKTLVEALNEANSSDPGLLCFTSCSENELSFEDEAWQNGAFTEALLEALDGKALNITPKIGEKAAPVSAKLLHEFLKQRVGELVDEKGKGTVQTPNLKLNDIKETLTIFAVPEQ